MEISITDINEVAKEIKVNLRANELVKHFEKAYEEYRPKAEINGFRKGKAPLALIIKLFGESIEYNALDTVASDVYSQIIKEKDIHPIGNPTLTDMDYKRGESFSFKVKYEIKPQIELKDYTAIALEKIIHKVTDQEINDEIERLRRAHNIKTETETATDEDHVIIADIQELDPAGSPLIGKKTANTSFYLSDETLNQQIKEAMKGISKNEIRKVNVETETDGSKQTNYYEFQIKKVEKVILPELNGDFIKIITKEKFSTVEDFKKNLKSDLEKYWSDRSERNLTDTMISEIVRRHDMVIPESLIISVTDSFIDELKKSFPNKKLPPDFDEKKFIEQNRSYAIFQSKWFIIRERIIEAEGLKVENSDIEQVAEAESTKTGIDKSRLINFYQNSESIKEKILSDKIITFLKQKSKITEVTEDYKN